MFAETEIIDRFVSYKETDFQESLRGGNQKIFEEIFRKYYAQLCQYAYSFLKDKDDAEDVVQQTFVLIWEKRNQIEITISAKSYLYRSVHNACLNKLKHQKIKSEYSQQIADISVNAYDSVSETFYKNELLEKIEKAINLLPEQCKVIFKMSRYDELKYQEIADKLGLSVKTIENQIGKALKIMRSELVDYLSIIVCLIGLLKK